MKKSRFFVILAILVFYTTHGQNIIYKGDQQYSATATWKFKCEAYTWSLSNLEVQIANGKTRGYVRLAISVPFEDHYIGGPFYIFLDNGTKITCTDKGIRDHVDQQTVVLYVLSLAEIEKLKQHNIQKVRFTIKSGSSKGSYSDENFTAANRKDTYGGLLFGASTEKDHYETAKEISKLFNEN